MNEQVALFVLNRDQGCVAPRLGGSSMDCGGRNAPRLEHVKDGPRMAKKAPDCPCSLVTLCSLHTEDGMRAGRVWATSRENREACREYLASFGYGEHIEAHAAYILDGVRLPVMDATA